MSKITSAFKKITFRKVCTVLLSVLLVALLASGTVLTVSMYKSGYFSEGAIVGLNSDFISSVGYDATDVSSDVVSDEANENDNADTNSKTDNNETAPTDSSVTAKPNTSTPVDTTVSTKGEVLIDEINDTSKMFSNTKLYFDPANASLLGNDNGRASRPHESLDSSIVYKVDEVNQIAMRYIIACNKDYLLKDNFVVQVSADNKNWKTVAAENITYKPINGASWMEETAYYSAIDSGNKYVKIIFPKTGELSHHWAAELCHVQINGITNEVLEAMGGCSTSLRKARTIYIDPVNGDDKNNGTSESKPLKTLNKASQLTYGPGDKILIKRGTTSTRGSLTVIGSGVEGKPITIGAYGKGDCPIIKARGGSAISYYGDNVKISDIWFTNETGEMGIDIICAKPGANKNITITNCKFYDINNNLKYTTHDSGGITVSANGWQANWLDGVKIENNKFERVGRCAVYVYSHWSSRISDVKTANKNKYVSDTNGWYPNLNVVVRKNHFKDSNGDSIVLSGCKGGLAEYNTVAGSKLLVNAGDIHFAAIWGYTCTDTIFQYNEVYGIKSGNGGDDLQAYDLDASNYNCIYQYNYSHDNAGGFMLFCGLGKSNRGDTANNIVRYNLSVNDGCDPQKPRAVFTFTGQVHNNQIYNNTVYLGGNEETRLLWFADWSYGKFGGSYDNSFFNNIFYGKDGVKLVNDESKIIEKGGLAGKLIMEQNVFCNVDVPIQSKITGSNITNATVKFAKAGDAGNGLKVGESYRIKKSISGTPKNISNNGGKDYFGKSLKGNIFGAIG